MYNLFLDDNRLPQLCRHYQGDESIYDTEEFIVVKTFDEFYSTIKKMGIPKFVSFDYDLNQKETGLDCASFLKFECDELGVAVPEYRVHSAWLGITSDFDTILKS